MVKDLKMYILVNKDIEISKGKLAGQVGHAVFEYMYDKLVVGLEDYIPELKEIFREYMNNNQKKIILKCSQSKLEELEQQGYITIRDLSGKELPLNTLTCVNLGIFDEENVPKFVKRLRLL